MRARTRLFPLLMLFASLGAALTVAAARVAWERDYRTVTIAVNYADLDPAGAREGAPAVFLELTSAECARLDLDEVQRDTADLALAVLLHVESGSAIEACLEALERLHPWALALLTEGLISQDDQERLMGFLVTQRPLLASVEFHADPFTVWVYRSGYRDLVRAHLIEREELEGLPLERALARWRRAVREREVRLLLVYLPATDGEGYLHEIIGQLEREGFTLGLVGPPRGFLLPVPVLVLIALGPLGLTMLVLDRSRLSWRRCWWVGVALALFILILGLVTAPTTTRLALAWLIAVLMPVLAYLLFPSRGAGLGHGVFLLFAFSGLTVLGGLWVGTLLAGTEFFLKIYQFRGVKAALVLPLLIALALHLRRSGELRLPRLRPMGIALLLLGGAVLILIVLRSDNLAPLVSGLELRLRELLEAAFYARPRFKEFLVGHPALLLWGSLRGRPPWDAALLGLSLLGQVSIINSFAHLHTPLLLSLLRTANGLVLGLPLGAIAYSVWRGGERLWLRRT